MILPAIHSFLSAAATAMFMKAHLLQLFGELGRKNGHSNRDAQTLTHGAQHQDQADTMTRIFLVACGLHANRHDREDEAHGDTHEHGQHQDGRGRRVFVQDCQNPKDGH
ncbi:hypothetical protein HG531_010085 [Fusarium graminearum]|nr:hypothetical protein HG531_010085 [Fusarium graminearum]